MGATSERVHASRLTERIWIRIAKYLYDVFFIVMVRDGSWQEPLISSLATSANTRILDFGPGSGSTAVALALRYPYARFTAVEPDAKAAERARQHIARRQITNVAVIEAPLCARLPFNAGSFDKVICILVFHDRLPDEKLAIAKEMIRVLRRGGTLHIADYDRPERPGEGRLLVFTRCISGPEAAEPHINGKWIGFIAKAGFSGVRRQSSHSIGIGRISVIKAHKR